MFGGEGDDFMLGGEGGDFLLGNEGDDWIEGGNGFDTTAGDNSELFFNSTIIGHDVMFAGENEHDFDAESGDDIMVQGESVMRNEGMWGYDWAIYKGNTENADADLTKPIFTTDQQDILRNRFDAVEGLSGYKQDDILKGDNRATAFPTTPDPEAEPGANLAGAENTMVKHHLSQAASIVSRACVNCSGISSRHPPPSAKRRGRPRSHSMPAIFCSAAAEAIKSKGAVATTSSTGMHG